MKHILLYVHDEVAFGHFSRMKKIASSLNRQHHVTLLVWGVDSLVVEEGIELIYLPHKFIEVEKQWWISLDQKILERKQVLSRVIRERKFSHFLIDYFPFWRHNLLGEIDFLLRALKQLHNTKTYSIMRDVFVWFNICSESDFKKDSHICSEHFWTADLEKVFEADIWAFKRCASKFCSQHFLSAFLLRYYINTQLITRVLTFWDKNIYALETEFAPHVSRQSFCYLWYILTRWNTQLSDKQDIGYILISLWWNVFNEENFFKILNFCKQCKFIRFKVVLWNMMQSEQQERIRWRFSAKNIEFIGFSWDFSLLLQGAKVFIWAGGYGTVTDALQYKMPSLLISNYNDFIPINKTEQDTRIKTIAQVLPHVYFIEKIDKDFMKKMLLLYKRENHAQETDAINLWGYEKILDYIETT